MRQLAAECGHSPNSLSLSLNVPVSNRVIGRPRAASVIDLYRVERSNNPEELTWLSSERLPGARQDKPTLFMATDP